jgi:hypothetical protein
MKRQIELTLDTETGVATWPAADRRVLRAFRAEVIEALPPPAEPEPEEEKFSWDTVLQDVEGHFEAIGDDISAEVHRLKLETVTLLEAKMREHGVGR